MLAPRVLLYPLVALATMAAIIASQALISGAFSLTQQAVQLGYSPRVNIIHTSKTEAGQIYIPEVNTALMIGCLLVVLGFRSSSALGAAYGIAVTGTMAITTILFYMLARSRWNWSCAEGRSAAAVSSSSSISAFFSSNALKILHGGWVPIIIGARDLHADDDVVSGPAHRAQASAARARCRSICSSNSVAEHKPVRVPGHSGVHDFGSRGCAARSAASPQAQQGSARAGRSAVGALGQRSRDSRGERISAVRCAKDSGE